MLLYISVRGIDCASASVILGLRFGTVLTLWYFSFHNGICPLDFDYQ